MRPRGTGNQGLTLVELIILIGVIVMAVLVVLLIRLARPYSGPGRNNCRSHIRQIGKAMYMYTQSYGGYGPFYWGLSGSVASEYRADLGISLLYPDFLETAKPFRCHETKHRPAFVQTGGVWVLQNSSYGYDCRVSPQAVSAHAILGDMDGSYSVNKELATQNHKGGQNILYCDGHVSWATTNFASNDELDNIFAEDPWNADTDSHLVWPGKPLGVSFDGYPELH